MCGFLFIAFFFWCRSPSDGLTPSYPTTHNHSGKFYEFFILSFLPPFYSIKMIIILNFKCLWYNSRLAFFMNIHESWKKMFWACTKLYHIIASLRIWLLTFNYLNITCITEEITQDFLFVMLYSTIQFSPNILFLNWFNPLLFPNCVYYIKAFQYDIL